MSGIFSKPKMPEPPPPPAPPPAPPGMDEARQARMQADELRRRRGRAATVLSEEGTLAPQTGTRKLLGE
jgi:hypothetical protein